MRLIDQYNTIICRIVYFLTKRLSTVRIPFISPHDSHRCFVFPLNLRMRPLTYSGNDAILRHEFIYYSSFGHRSTKGIKSLTAHYFQLPRRYSGHCRYLASPSSCAFNAMPLSYGRRICRDDREGENDPASLCLRFFKWERLTTAV